MNTFTLQVPAAQVVLDNHARARNLLESANTAVFEAVRSYAEFSEAAPSSVFGSINAFNVIAESSRAGMQHGLSTGMPIFDIRIATPDFLEALSGARGGVDAAFHQFVATLGSDAPVSSLGCGPLTADSAILDVHSQVRKKIESANTAVLDAVRAYMDAGDPMAPYVFGVSRAVLTRLAAASHSRLITVIQTGVPIFSLREPIALANEDDEIPYVNSALIQMLRSFASMQLLAA